MPLKMIGFDIRPAAYAGFDTGAFSPGEFGPPLGSTAGDRVFPVWRGRRSDYMLAALIVIALANGVFLGLTLYGLLAAVLGVIGGRAPGFGYALLAGASGGGYLLFVSLLRERALRHGEHRLWTPLPAEPGEHPLVAQLRKLSDAGSLERPPTLGCVESRERNAFCVGRSREEASIIVTTGLIRSLAQRELDAVLAQQLAQIESDSVKAVGLADAIAATIADLIRLKGRFLWGPKAILWDLRPFLLAVGLAFVISTLVPEHAEGNALLSLLFVGALFWALYAMWQTAKMSWRGLTQAFIFTTFLGPLSVVEAVLSPPTAVLISRLVSRARVHEADERAVELTGGAKPLALALKRIGPAKSRGLSGELGGLRYSLFVGPMPPASRWPWLGEQQATHPSISSRLDTIERLD
jgi:Zn-dependent protease with chaperone function